MAFDKLLNPKLPRLWHGGDYNPEQWPPEVWDEDMRLMRDSRFHVATIGVFSWVTLEPAEGRYDFGWLDGVADRLEQVDRWFILSTPSAAPPAWMSKKYPEILRTGADRVRRLHGGRVNYNLGSTVYKDKTREIAQKLAERYGAHPRLLAWHLSNEYSGADYGPESTAQFQDWLKKKFNGDLKALNAAYWTAFWSHTYTDWNQIEPPGSPHGETSIQGLTVDWQRFVTDQTIDFMENEAAPLRKISPTVPITTNFMGTYPGLDYRKVAKHLDFTCWDSYPSFETPLTETITWVVTSFKHDLTRCLLPDRPWLLMESTPSASNWYKEMSLKKPGMHVLEGWQAVAHGADGVQYFQWRQSRGSQEQLHGAVVSHAGAHNTRVYGEVKQLGVELDRHPDIVGSLPKADVAIVYDWNVRWAIDAACGPTQRDKGYQATCVEHYRAFWQAGISTDIVGLEDDLSRYKLVIAPMAYSLTQNFVSNVEQFVRNGGTFLTTYLSGWVDENSLVFEGGFLRPLREVLGVWSEEIDVLAPNQKNSIDFHGTNALGIEGSHQATEFCELIHADSANVLAVYGRDFYAGRPAVTENRFGSGRAYYVAARCDSTFTSALLHKLAKQCGIARAVPGELPYGVTAQLRFDDRERHLFLLNTNSTEAFVDTAESGPVRLAPYGTLVISSPKIK